MGDKAPIVVDTNVLLNLATAAVDSRPIAPSGQDPLAAVLSAYDVHVPEVVLGEVSEATRSGDLLAAAAGAVLQAARHLSTHAVDDELEGSLDYGLDVGESRAIWLANEIGAEMLVTDEFNSTNYLLVSLALDDPNILFTTPHVLCALADHDILDAAYVDAALTYFVETKSWDRVYIDQLRARYISG